MLRVNVSMKYSHQPLKRAAVELVLDEDSRRIGPVATDRTGLVQFDLEPSSGKILVSGVERYQGRLQGDINIELINLTNSGFASEGAVSSELSGSNAYPGMTTRRLQVDGQWIETDSEGYLVNPDDWSEAFVRQQAANEQLSLTSEHWEMIRFQRQWFSRHGKQATVRDMIKVFRESWGKEKGSNYYLHKLFPRGGPQKQGNRLAGLLRTKGEH